MTTYAMIDADGHSGDYVTVWETTDDEKKARGMKLRGGSSVQVLAGVEGHVKGDRIARGIVSDMVSSGLWSPLA